MPVSECVGVGWKNLVDPLEEVCKLAHVEILQVKEKFGGLRFYVGDAPEWLFKLINTAERMSFKTCESCGVHDGQWAECISEDGPIFHKVTTSGGWLKTLCNTCRMKK